MKNAFPFLGSFNRKETHLKRRREKEKNTAFTEIFVVGLTFFTKCSLQF